MRSLGIRLPRILALVVVALVVGLTIRLNSFTPWGTDSAAYIDAAHRWADADLFSPTTFVFWAPWSFGGNVEIPLGQRPGPTIGSAVGIYPLGYPLLLAAALEAGGSLAPYLVAPLFAGLLVWCAFLLASQLSGPWAGLIASVLIAATPVTLANAVSPMSDVPAAALWALSWVLSLRPGLGATIASGCAAAFAIMVRPNLAPLAGIVAIVAVASTGASFRKSMRFLTFVTAAMLGPAMVLWSQGVLYGNPFTAGYGSPGGLFSAERILPNLALYPRLLVELHGWLVVIGLLAFPFTVARTREHLLVAISAIGFIVTNLALYLPFLTYEGWYWLRFMLPALLAVVVLFAASMDRIRQLLASRSALLSAVAILPVLIVAINPRLEIRQLFRDTQNQRRVPIMGDYLREAVRPNAVILTYLQSGAVAHYTGRPVVRLDYLDSTLLDSVIQDLSRRGYQPAFVIDDGMESSALRARFVGSTFEAIDWPARAEFWSSTPLSYFVAADRMGFHNGEIYPVDVVGRSPSRPTQDQTISTPDVRQSPFPPAHESIAFTQMLDEKYRDDLHRTPSPSYLDAETWVVWLQRYLRYRLHACSHTDAMSSVFQQIGGGAVPPPCSNQRGKVFPPRDEVVDFRRQLELKYQGDHNRPVASSHVDAEGDAVWMQEYLRHRVERCSHEQAATRVFEQIEGRTVQPGC